MPIYEYRCSSCGHQQEFLQKVSDAQLTTCTQCGKPTFSKMLSAAGFQLKGSGWYATDFKASGSKPAAKSGDDAKTSGNDSKKAGGEAKPAAETKSEDKKAAPSSGAGGTPAS
ncbi:MAG TPA: zinc ribbon domain-containing protein [Usitatibacter sp.]|nr:zinc ribbon domain-containing protein [Usitatibacter sp.]